MGLAQRSSRSPAAARIQHGIGPLKPSCNLDVVPKTSLKMSVYWLSPQISAALTLRLDGLAMKVDRCMAFYSMRFLRPDAHIRGALCGCPLMRARGRSAGPEDCPRARAPNQRTDRLIAPELSGLSTGLGSQGLSSLPSKQKRRGRERGARPISNWLGEPLQSVMPRA